MVAGESFKSAAAMVGRLLNEFLSFIVFAILDILDVILCYAYKVADLMIESESKPCYCSSGNGSGAGGRVTSCGGRILVAEPPAEPKMVRLTRSKLQLEEISDTLYARSSSLVSKSRQRSVPRRPAFIVDSTTTVRIGRQPKLPIPRWSDCDCATCTSWTSSSKESLFVKVDGAKDNVEENVLFIHGFISSSAFWTETVYPNLSWKIKSKYRLLAVDLLGFGRSPKPVDSMYTVREHVDMIERSVLHAHGVKSFHVVAHSLGCILAIALAVRHPGSVKSLTLLAPPYFPTPNGEMATQYMMRRVAPRRIWPLIAFGASMACWYEHISRTICLLICKNHRIWEFIAKLFTSNRVILTVMEGFFLHTHNAAWHTLHNVICGTAGKIEGYLDMIKEQVKCDVTVFHGEYDELIPVECSHNLKSRIPRAHVKVVEKKDHITIVAGREKTFTRELEEIWKFASEK